MRDWLKEGVQVIVLERDDGVFVYRVAGVALSADQRRVLIHRAERDDFWSLPGGRVELHELAGHALARELREETGEAVEVGRLLWAVESLFAWDGRRHHEICLYFPISFAPGSWVWTRPTFDGSEGATRLLFRWHEIAALDQLTVYPAFLRERLLRANDQVVGATHIVDVAPCD